MLDLVLLAPKIQEEVLRLEVGRRKERSGHRR
jgi:hypothetical protein